jgi:sulfur transfer complex TusBCD TusB component (DsrH family)
MEFAKFTVQLSEDLYARGIYNFADHLLEVVRLSSARVALVA